MIVCNLGAVISAGDCFVAACDELSGAYNCSWNDEVHDSYGAYVTRCHTLRNEYASAATRLKQVKSDIESIDTQPTEANADSISGQIDSM